MWYKVEDHHWQNHNDKHLIWDKENKTLSTEDWSKSPISVVVIPIQVLEKFLPENRYYIIPEAKYLASERAVAAKLQANVELMDEVDTVKSAKKEIAKKARSTANVAVRIESAYEEALSIVEQDSEQIKQLKYENAQLQKAVAQHESNMAKVIELANKEIQRLKDRLNEPKA